MKLIQYYSKWREDWVTFTDESGNYKRPTTGELKALKRYHYKIREIDQYVLDELVSDVPQSEVK